jgi:hypothetical protein
MKGHQVFRALTAIELILNLFLSGRIVSSLGRDKLETPSTEFGEMMLQIGVQGLGEVATYTLRTAAEPSHFPE